METKSQNTENGSAVPGVQTVGTTAAGIDSERGIIKVCPHAFCGCISNAGYTCRHEGPCEPVDGDGRKFTVSYIVEGGQRFMTRAYARRTVLPIIDAEKANAALWTVEQLKPTPATVREQCLAKLAEIRAGPHSVRTVH